MDAPKCRLCEKRHYGLCDPKDLPALASDTDLPTLEEGRKIKAKLVKQKPQAEDGPLSQVERNKRYRKKKGAEYRKKHREYMRKKRAEKDTGSVSKEEE